MAIQNKHNADIGYIFDKAYYRIENVKVDTERELCRIEIRVYAHKEARDNNALGVDKQIIEVAFNELKLTKFSKEDIKTACYKYLLTLKEYKGGVNV